MLCLYDRKQSFHISGLTCLKGMNFPFLIKFQWLLGGIFLFIQIQCFCGTPKAHFCTDVSGFIYKNTYRVCLSGPMNI